MENNQNQQPVEKPIISEDKKQFKEKQENYAIDIRRSIREEILNKNRDLPKLLNQQNNSNNNVQNKQQQQQQQQQQNEAQVIYSQTENDYNFDSQMPQNKMTPPEKMDPTPDDVESHIQMLKQMLSPEQVINSVSFLRDCCSYTTCNRYQNHITRVVASQITDSLFKIFYGFTDQNLQISILKLMTSILTGTTKQTESIVDHEFEYAGFKQRGIEFFNKQLELYMNQVNSVGMEVTLYAIGNIVGTKQEYREYFIKEGLQNSIIKIFQYFDFKKKENVDILKHSAWSLCSLTRDEAPVGFGFNIEMVVSLVHSFQQSNDDEFLTDVSWSMYQICSQHIKLDKTDEYKPTYQQQQQQDSLTQQSDQIHNNSAIIKHLLDSNILDIIKKCLFNVNMPIILPGLKLFRLLLRGPLDITKNIFEQSQHTIFARIQKLVDHSMRLVRLEALRVISDVAKKENIEINKVLQTQFINKIIIKASKEDTVGTKECLKLLSNLFDHLGDDEIFLLLNNDLYEILALHTVHDTKTDSEMILYTLLIVQKMIHFYQNNKTLQDGRGYLKIRKQIDQYNIMRNIEDLQTHPNERIYKLAFSILESFKDEQDDNYGLYEQTGIDVEQ